jgi:carotenoid cleavage dioxygenase
MQGEGKLTLHRFTFDLATGGVSEETLDERPMEFPRIADARVGLKNRYAYTLAFNVDPSAEGADMSGIYKIDNESGRVEEHDMGAGRHPGEPVFVPAAGSAADSDAGYLLTYVYDDGSGKSELVILDAASLQSAPIARVKLPQRVPFGFHGSWIADA